MLYHDSNTFVIAGKVASASVTVVSGQISSNLVGTDDTLSFFAGIASGQKKGVRKMTIDRTDLKIYSNSDSTTELFTVTETATKIAGNLSVSGITNFDGAVTLGNATGDDITVTGYIASHIIPTCAPPSPSPISVLGCCSMS